MKKLLKYCLAVLIAIGTPFAHAETWTSAKTVDGTGTMHTLHAPGSITCTVIKTNEHEINVFGEDPDYTPNHHNVVDHRTIRHDKKTGRYSVFPRFELPVGGPLYFVISAHCAPHFKDLPSDVQKQFGTYYGMNQ